MCAKRPKTDRQARWQVVARCAYRHGFLRTFLIMQPVFLWAGAALIASADGAGGDNPPIVPSWGPVSTSSAGWVAGPPPTSTCEILDKPADTSGASTSTVPAPAPLPIVDVDGEGNPGTAVYLGCYFLEEEQVASLLDDVGDPSLTPMVRTILR